LKVLHVIPSLWAGDGGPARAIVAMEEALAAQGVKVETAATDDAGPGRRSGVRLEVPLQEGGATRRHFAKRTDFYKLSPSFGRWIAAHVREYDLLHVHGLFSYTSIAAARAARRAGVPYIIRPLGTLDAWGLAQRRPALKRASLQLIEAPLLRDAAAVHFTSDDEAAQAEATGIPMQAVVIPLGIAMPEAGARPQPGDAFRVLYLSRLAPKKNVEGLLEAAALLMPETPGLHLCIAGDGEAAYARSLHERASALGLDRRVTWLGHVEGEAKERAFAEADVFALPSHSENFGIAAAEALARGLPCVLGRGVAIAAEVEAAGAGKSVGPAPSEIAAGLKLMIPRDARATSSANARRLARERYSLDAMGARLAALYADILAKRHGSAKH
jgi:glycosyltransferase involved in cell wall biosynthesis